jgi:GDP-L-fucose synthase
MSLRGKKIVVTGGTGFVGSFVVEQLLAEGARVRVVGRERKRAGRFLSDAVLKQIEVVEADLSSIDGARRAMRGQEGAFLLSAVVAGIQRNMSNPGTMFRENMMLALQSLEACRLESVERVLVTSTACVYPRECTIPTPEAQGFKDRPDPSNEGYGWAKRMFEFLGESYTREFGLDCAIVRPYNCYGPRDNFEPSHSHVISSLIRRIWGEKETPLNVWGSGKQSRSFLYVEDCAEGLIEVFKNYRAEGPVNLGTPEEVTIAELVRVLSELHLESNGTPVEYRFDTSKPEGQPRRACDNRKLKQTVGFEAKWKLKDGLRETIRWYLEHEGILRAAA